MQLAPEKLRAGILALLVHLIFLALLIFGVSWQNREPAPVQVDLWSSLPASPAQAPPPPRQERVAKKTPPPPREAAAPKHPKAEIKLKTREKETARKEKLKQEEQKRRQQELDKERQERAQAAQRLQQEQQELERVRLAQAAAAQARIVADYKSRINAKIKRHIILPPEIQGNPQAEFEVILLPGGEVLSIKLVRSSGQTAYDNAVERAIYKAQPLPLPSEPSLFGRFRELNLKFRPREGN